MKKYLLNEIGEILTGNTPSKKNEEYYNSSDIPFLKPNDLSVNEILSISDSTEYISFAGKKASRIIPKGSVLVTCIGIIGKVGILDLDQAAFNQQINAIIPNDNIVNSKYLAYKLMYKRKELEHMANAPVVPIINKTQFSNLEISLPSIQIQERIVEILDKAQSLINKRKAQITALSDLTQSVFLEMFGDPITNKKKFNYGKLGDLVNKITDGTHHSPPMVNKGVPYVSAKHLGTGELDFYKNPAYVSIEEHRKIYQRCNPVKGDVLYIKDGATTGIAAVNHYDFEFSMLSSLALIKCENGKLNNNYLVYYLNNLRVKEKILNNMSGGAIKRLTLKKINDIDIMLPPIELQNEFSLKVEKIEEQQLLIKKSSLQLENNFNSLIQRAFKGELFND